MGMPKGMEFRKDDQMATRYAVVRVANDTVQSVDRTHLVSLDEEALKELGLRIAQGTATKGWEGAFAIKWLRRMLEQWLSLWMPIEKRNKYRD